MYTALLMSHSFLRWIVLIVLLVTLTKYVLAWTGGKPWTKTDNILGVVFTSIMDLQLLLGLVLYFFVSPITKTAFSDFGAAMKDADLRFYAVEHFSMMLIALALVHVGRAKSKKAATDQGKFKTATLFFVASLILILLAIPWHKV
jgi:hypothetical protein